MASSSSASDDNTRMLFVVGFCAIVATSFCFVLRALVIDDWGVEFALSQTQKGELLGAGLWPFSLTIVLFSLIIDKVGFRAILVIAALCQAVGLALMLTAHGYWGLYFGTLISALGNGSVEAAANPLVATLFRHDKPKWLNRVHAGWPGGLILGGMLAMALGAGTDWRYKIALGAIPIVVYSLLLIGRKFPVSERVASGVSYRSMLAEAGALSAFVVIALAMLEIGRVADMSPNAIIISVAVLTAGYGFFSRSIGSPLFFVLVLIMIPAAITELGTDSWISSLMEPQMRRLGLQAGWVLVYTSAVVFVIRIYAGALIHRFKPLGVLAFASGIAAIGLFLLSGATGLGLLAAATLYGIGKSFFWGTNLGVVGEQFPRGGAVTLNMIAGAGMLAAGIVGSTTLGALQDHSTSAALHSYDAAHNSNLSSQYLSQHQLGFLGSYEALDADKAAAAPADVKAVLAPILSGSQQQALEGVALLPLVMLLAYGGLMLFFRRRGGYRPVELAAEQGQILI